jgi:tripartite-type tricarboxylate transporter receptor subunit TctC
MRHIFRMLVGIWVALMLTPTAIAFAAWPERTITIIVHFAPGGGTDMLGRLVAAELAPILGQSLVVENRVGANGSIGIAMAARAKPDGYTLLAGSGSALVNPAMGKVTYDFLRDFVPIAYLGSAPCLIVTRPDSGISDFADLIAKAKLNPGKITYATPGVGSTTHVGMELLKLRTGTNMLHVPFTGLGPAMNATIAGTTDIASLTVSGTVGQVKGGTLKVLLQTGKERWPEFPDVPTVAEAGFPEAENEVQQFILAPAGTPPEIVERLQREIIAIMQRPDIRERMFVAGFASTPRDGAFLRNEIEQAVGKWKMVVEQAGLARN